MSTVPQRLGHYELRQQLGRGNVGEVWKGYDAQLQRDVAIKVIYTDLQSDPNFITRFTQQGQKITSLHHPNIVQVRDVAINQQSPETTAYIVSDYIESHALSEYIAAKHHEGTVPPLSEIVYLFTSLGVAIDYAHQKGVVHGNIKPSNILLDKRHATHFMPGEPMLTDFGLALLLGEEAGIGTIGTPQYMSPEQVKGDPANNRSDIYSLGVVLYELCTGVQPFRDESSVAVMMQHINTLPTPPILINPQLPPALSEVILRAMAKDTATRFPMASLLATAIADACSIRPTLSIPRVAVAEEDSAYHTASGLYGSFLGVPQPLSPTPSPARPISQPIPRIHPRISSPSRPLPAVAQQMNSPRIPTVSGKQQVIQPTLTGALMTNKVPVISTPPTPSSTTSAKVAVPPSQKEYSAASQNPTFSPSTGRLVNTPFPVSRKSSQSRITDVPMYAVLAVCAVILLIAASIIGNLLLNAKGQPGSIAGHVFFQDDALGHADALRMDMQNISAPPQGKTYQGWLQDTMHQTIPLGSLTLNNDTATLLYPGDAQHTNLLSIARGVIVTLEDIANKASRPTGNTIYEATFDAPSFQYIKNILYKTPGFPADNGVIVGLFETIKSINDKAGSVVDSIQGTHDYALARRQAIRIIELTDGTAYSMASGDLPKNTPSNVYARVGLISSPTQPGYIDTLSTQLDKLQQAAGNNSTLLTHIQNVRNAVADLRAWAQQIRTYDVQLVKAKHLTDPALANVALQLKQVVGDSYTGRTIPPDEGPKPTPGSAGAYQAYVECQYLTTLDIKHV